MDAVTLLTRARAAGLSVTADGDRLVVRGPKDCAPIAEELLANKAEVMALLSARGQPLAALDFASTLREAWRRACFELGEAAGWPELPYKPGHAVAPGAALWGKWIERASVPDMQRTLAALHEYLAALPRPEGPISIVSRPPIQNPRSGPQEPRSACRPPQWVLWGLGTS